MRITTFSGWAETTATTLATNARGRYVHAIKAVDEVPKVQAAIKRELHEAYRRGQAYRLMLAGAGWVAGLLTGTFLAVALIR